MNLLQRRATLTRKQTSNYIIAGNGRILKVYIDMVWLYLSKNLYYVHKLLFFFLLVSHLRLSQRVDDCSELCSIVRVSKLVYCHNTLPATAHGLKHTNNIILIPTLKVRRSTQPRFYQLTSLIKVASPSCCMLWPCQPLLVFGAVLMQLI